VDADHEPSPAAAEAPATPPPADPQPPAPSSDQAPAEAPSSESEPPALDEAEAAPPSDEAAPSEAPAPDAAEGATESPTKGEAKQPSKGKGARERIAQDRALQAARRRALLTGRLATGCLVFLVLVGLAFLGRRPLLRTLARAGEGELNQWALNVLAGLEDPGAFDLYVAKMGVKSDQFTPLVYRLAGRDRAPDDSGIPPDDPDQIEEHRQVLIKAVREDEPELQRGGLRAFACLRKREWIRDPELLQSVADALSSKDAISRRFAAIGLRNVAPTPLHQARLLNSVRSDTDRLVRRFAVQALARSQDPSLGAELAALEDEAPEVQRELFLALARLGVPVPLKRLRALYSEFPTLRQTVVESLSKRDEAGVDELIEVAIRDPSPGTRLAAAKALRERTRAEGLDALCYALGDADPAVRLESIDSIVARSDGKRALPSLVGALEDHQGWEELRRLHVTLETLTRHQGVPDPVQSQELTWARTQAAWRSYLRGQRKQ
jgi:HEAT repeat protein